jgi:hypothetical protein
MSIIASESLVAQRDDRYRLVVFLPPAAPSLKGAGDVRRYHAVYIP